MSAAAPAMNLGTCLDPTAVRRGLDCMRKRRPETRPTCAALELGCGRKERQGATTAKERAFAVLVQEGTCEWRLGTLLAQNIVLGGRQEFPPLRIRVGDFKRLCGCRQA